MILTTFLYRLPGPLFSSTFRKKRRPLDNMSMFAIRKGRAAQGGDQAGRYWHAGVTMGLPFFRNSTSLKLSSELGIILSAFSMRFGLLDSYLLLSGFKFSSFLCTAGTLSATFSLKQHMALAPQVSPGSCSISRSLNTVTHPF